MSTRPGDEPVRELVFVVDITSFTKGGFLGSTTFRGRKLDIEFDDGDGGVSLDEETAALLGAKKGTPLSMIVEDERTVIVNSEVAQVGKKVRISDAKVYYTVGREGGAVVRVRPR